MENTTTKELVRNSCRVLIQIHTCRSERTEKYPEICLANYNITVSGFKSICQTMFVKSCVCLGVVTDRNVDSHFTLFFTINSDSCVNKRVIKTTVERRHLKHLISQRLKHNANIYYCSFLGGHFQFICSCGQVKCQHKQVLMSSPVLLLMDNPSYFSVVNSTKY